MNDNHPAYALQPGARLQEFEILGVLGSGGFGITYLAQDHDLNCRVVIKEYFPRDHVLREQGSSTVRPHSAKDHDFYQYGLQRFQEEARTLASFPEHPNIVSVKRFFNANASAYMVMPYVEGQTFGQWLLANPQPTEEQLLDIFLPVLDGLRAVHQHNYLHRDIKPANIYLRSDGRPLLIDFGAARQALGEHSKSLSVVISEGYAPKEQYSSKGKHGPWTDIYGVGACLWRAVTGQEPPSATDRVEARDDGAADPLRAASALGQGSYSPAFLKAIDWSLQLLPQDRPQTVRDWQDVFQGNFIDTASPQRQQKQIPVALEPAQKNAAASTWKIHALVLTIGLLGVVLWYLGAFQPPQVSQSISDSATAVTDPAIAQQQQQLEEALRQAKDAKHRAEEAEREAKHQAEERQQEAERIAEQERLRLAEEAEREAKRQAEERLREAERIAEQERLRLAEEAYQQDIERARLSKLAEQTNSQFQPNNSDPFSKSQSDKYLNGMAEKNNLIYQFIEYYFSLASADVSQELLDLFTEPTDYYSKKSASHSFIVEDIRRYIKIFPSRSYEIITTPALEWISSDYVNAEFLVQYNICCKAGRGPSNGQLKMMISFVKTFSGWKISSINSKKA
jgi:serine/threonine protein kinase